MTAPARPAAAREGVSFHASSLLVGSGIAAFVSTILLALLWYFDASAPPRPPTSGQPPPPPPSHPALMVAVGLFTIAWVAVIAALCRDQVVRRINLAVHQITTATLEFGDHRETEGYLLARRHADGAPDSPAGDVLPFARPHALDPDSR